MSSAYNIRGIPVSFPFEPYELQKQYMEKVIQCLQNSENGILESPTGTGKTLSLLCSSLAWLADKKAKLLKQLLEDAYKDDFSFHEAVNCAPDAILEKPMLDIPRIIYSSRTHSQLSQAMQELRRTAYADVQSTVLGGRDQLCIHPDVMQEKSNSVKGNLCGIKIKTKSCQFHNRAEKKNHESLKNIMDIEDLVVSGKKDRFCPYYMSRDLHKQADITFMPYNYLLDAKVRKSLSINLENCVVIFDEAHNIERICEDSASTQLKKSDLVVGIDEVKSVTDLLTGDSSSAFLQMEQMEKLNEINMQKLTNLKQTLVKLVNVLDCIEIKDLENGSTFPGDHIYQILEKAYITYSTKDSIRTVAESIIQFLSTLTVGPITHRGNGLGRLLNLLDLVFVGSENMFNPAEPDEAQLFIAKVKKCYKVHVSQTYKDGGTIRRNAWASSFHSEKCDRILSFWCFSPGFGMNILMEQKPKCLILTSGTLAPIKPLISELELKIDVILENPHIVSSDQVCVKVISKGPDMQLLSSSYNNRQNPHYIASLGRTIQNICRILPGGILIFFPSYTVMNLCQTAWQESGLWASISKIKPIFVEPRDKDEFRQNMKDYYRHINDTKYAAAIFMGVCRGKVSEGLDFADANGRGVIITGLPYPPLMDARVVLKKEYLDNCKKLDKQYLSGAEWYQLEASRAVNQAIGRVIRHRNDYGIILLADSRFVGAGIRANMSKWLQNRIQVVPNFGNLMATMKQLFQEATKNYPVKLETIDEHPPPPSEVELKESTTFIPKKDDSLISEYENDNSSDSSLEFIANSPEEKAVIKRRKLSIEHSNISSTSKENSLQRGIDKKDFILMLRNILDYKDFIKMANALTDYSSNVTLEPLITCIQETFTEKANIRHILKDMLPYLHDDHVKMFNSFYENFKSL